MTVIAIVTVTVTMVTERTAKLTAGVPTAVFSVHLAQSTAGIDGTMSDEEQQ